MRGGGGGGGLDSLESSMEAGHADLDSAAGSAAGGVKLGAKLGIALAAAAGKGGDTASLQSRPSSSSYGFGSSGGGSSSSSRIPVGPGSAPSMPPDGVQDLALLWAAAAQGAAGQAPPPPGLQNDPLLAWASSQQQQFQQEQQQQGSSGASGGGQEAAPVPAKRPSMQRGPSGGSPSAREQLQGTSSAALVDLNPWRVQYSDLVIQRPLGEGSFGKVRTVSGGCTARAAVVC